MVSGLMGLLIMSIPMIFGLYMPQKPYLIPLSQKVNNVMVSGLITALIFPAILEFNNYKWNRQVDRNIPKLLRDVAEAVRSGITLPRALEEASQRDYGPLSKELENAVSMFILGESWQDSLTTLAQRLRRPSALRLSSILVEAHQTGGKVVEVIDTSVDLFSSLDQYKEEQYSNMRPYVVTIYMAVIIFLVIAKVLLHQFLTPLYETLTRTELRQFQLLVSILDINYYTSILFWASIIESIFGGLVAGKIGERTLSAGLIHSVILSIITFFFFNIPFI